MTAPFRRHCAVGVHPSPNQRRIIAGGFVREGGMTPLDIVEFVEFFSRARSTEFEFELFLLDHNPRGVLDQYLLRCTIRFDCDEDILWWLCLMGLVANIERHRRIVGLGQPKSAEALLSFGCGQRRSLASCGGGNFDWLFGGGVNHRRLGQRRRRRRLVVVVAAASVLRLLLTVLELDHGPVRPREKFHLGGVGTTRLFLFGKESYHGNSKGC